MITKADMADVLEKAADLYEAEKYEWCEGAWFVERDNECLALGDPAISVCASTALGLACDLSLSSARDMENVYMMLRNVHVGLTVPNDIPFQYTKYFLAREQVDRHLVMRLGADADLPTWNDGGHGRDVTKPEVIELFKEIAKDLRNEQ